MQVECRSDNEYAGTPLAFTWQEERLEITEILTRWRSPEGKGFQVLAADSRVYNLLYNEHKDQWTINPQ